MRHDNGNIMARKHWWLAGSLASVGLAGLAATTGVVALATRFITELTTPHRDFTDDDLQGPFALQWQAPEMVPEPSLQMQRTFLLRVPNGPLLHGDFWVQPQPAPTVILCHGYRVSRARLRPVAALEYQHGCNVLLFDFRGHGESEGNLTSGGAAEVRDLRAMIDFAAAQPETQPDQILIHGFSMGATVALLALPHPHVAAVIADSPYARLDDIMRRLVRWQLETESAAWKPWLCQARKLLPGVAWAIVAVSSWVFRVRFHFALFARPAVGLRHWPQRIASTPILLIHALRDPLIPMYHSERLATAAQGRHLILETYYVDDDVHCGAYGFAPACYVATLSAFVQRHTSFLFALPTAAV